MSGRAWVGMSFFYYSGASSNRRCRSDLHVPTAIDDQQDVDGLVHDSVDETVRFEENLAIFPDAQRQQLLRISAALGEFGQADESLLDLLQNVIRFFRRISARDIVVKLVQVMRRVIGQQNGKRHQRVSRRSRRRLTTSAAGWTLPSSIWRLPSARIFSSAIVSWVCS